ncbi:FtsW/RodA/SpoVE family cell cycle protein [Candidatus Saccharibacteria bacterium]|nr:FtsW/RodA/SpoVE family cell cycle protein [Candidatus Saccharibacteria bacterium]MBR2989685.1 FtsW/RodA/SpoVE family cell cycle protein [Candidatus Saccharibacteria bacterium]
MRKHKSDRVIAILTFVLMAVGLIVIFAIGPQRVNFMNASLPDSQKMATNAFFMAQLKSVVVATVGFILAFKFPYEKLRQYAKWIMLAGVVCCVILAGAAAVKAPVAMCELGGCRWINLGVTTFQPAELLKLGLVLYLAGLAAKWKKAGKLETRDFLQPFAIVSVVSLVFVVVLQKDLGTGIVLVMIILAILYMSGIQMKYFLIALGILAAGGVFAIVSSPHRLERMMTFSGQGSSDETYHIDNAKMAIGTGGLLGVGIGNSVQATGYLPESINDSVFAVMGETFGFVGLLAIIAVFFWLLSRILKVSAKLETERSLVTVGVFAWIATQTIVNIAAMTGLIPLTGITLPLLSYGGTSMLFVAIGLGIVCQLSCYTGREVNRNEDISSGRRLGGTYHTSRRRSA